MRKQRLALGCVAAFTFLPLLEWLWRGLQTWHRGGAVNSRKDSDLYLRLLNPIEDQRDAAAQQPAPHNGGEQLDKFQLPHRPLSLHHFPDAALDQDDG